MGRKCGNGRAMRVWADAGASRLESLLRLLVVRMGFLLYAHRYRAYVAETHRDLDMKGISVCGAFVLELEQVFVDVRLDPVTPAQVSTDPSF